LTKNYSNVVGGPIGVEDEMLDMINGEKNIFGFNHETLEHHVRQDLL
jgi:hypothetical protein